MTRILLLSTSDTDLLSARSSGASYDLGNPSRTPPEGLPDRLAGVDLVVVRILGTARTWQEGLDAITASGTPTVVLGGEQTPDAELMSLSTVPVGIAAQAHAYLAQGGPANLAQLHAFLSDTVLLTGEGFEPPAVTPEWGRLDRPAVEGDRVRIGVLFYRAHETSGNTAFVHTLADAIDATGEAVGLPIFSSSLRTAPADLIQEFGTLDALIVTVLAAGGSRPAAVSAGEDDEAWDVAAMAALDIPVLQGLCLTWSREDWADSDDGVSPLDSATQVAIPEFDGRIITVPFSFKEIDEDGLPSYVADDERCARLAGIAVGHARLRRLPAKDRKIALMLSAYPTKHSRIGNAVGLDTPVSAIRLLRAMRDAGYDLGTDNTITRLLDTPAGRAGRSASGVRVETPAAADAESPRTATGFDSDSPSGSSGSTSDGGDTAAGNALIHALIDAGGQDEEWLTHAQLTDGTVRIAADDYRRWTAHLPDELTDAMRETWGEAPGELFVNDAGEIVLATLQAGNVIVMIQPPRGFGENPVAIYHDPDMPPSHHYLAAYRWLEHGFGAHAVVHLGKHGSMEWLPGKNAALSAACATDAAIGSMPLIYPFLVNDPGEGAQAKRRAHATIVDHLIPPMARAESYGDIARLEQLLDEYANIAAMDPAKLPAIRAQIWTLMQAARMDHDLGLTDRPEDEQFDDFLLHVDGWLCEVKDAQIRDGLHVLGAAPTGEARVNLVLSILRASQVWSGQAGALPGLRTALGLKEGGADTRSVDAVEQHARSLVQAMEDADWSPAAVEGVVAEHAPTAEPDVRRVLTFAATEVVPRLARTTDELDHVLHALDGGYVPAGPSGSPLRGLVNVLPTGRNFYTVDPKAVPSRLAFETGQHLASSLLERYLADTGEYPRSVGLSVWGTSAMRTSGDDVAEVLALLGVRPVWDEASRRVTDLQVVPLDELDRPRIDVTVRISGFFRDAFPHVVGILDDAVRLVAALDEPAEQNFVRAHAQADLAEHGDERRSTTRIFGSKPGAYGAGILPLIESGSWRDDADLAEVYTTWGGYAYGRDLDGAPAQDDMRSAYRRIAVAAKNTDTREHDIADSDDYFQYHGGMVATVRALTGQDPAAYIGDSTSPDVVRTRSLDQETSRVFRSRVVNPRWISAMQRHGYKGAFELAATVDYLFGYDATTGVVTDHMYETLAQTYALDEQNQQFMRQANPWALRGIIERLHEAHDRQLWEQPEPGTLEALQQVYLDLEGDLEDREQR
ncbi:cobaltochelatase subunit CobN [Luteipulveratus sp. YIM 133132]|uniref:Cobaltochelatase subunit CobN n=1 Tax=Luteipulveratus flavus TaxID=3031728 RepID=A0ABT6C685_9MICO|nr:MULTISPECIES: cobaltochelatase subunit CobN [unclassified Luteipulveratus]MDE9365225.1 cobaltochelatase subunit CobN [Luteipulveratus sp. YIM 133132]MDF8264438.1 cobaltochelatase subunit CobN [Luteipulveratus sp. YIM 133296]